MTVTPSNNLPQLMTNHSNRQSRREVEEEESDVGEQPVPERRIDFRSAAQPWNQKAIDAKLHGRNQQEQVGQSSFESVAKVHHVTSQKRSRFGETPQGLKSRSGRVLVLTTALVAALGLFGVAGAEEAGSSAAKATTKASPAPLLILLDPGHGGTNTGAPSIREDIFEKHVTLALAGALRTRLQAKGFDVRLTRSHDEYLTLRQRGRMANELDVDLFVSLHANATDNHSHSGYEVFILTPDAVDVDSRALRHDSGRVRPGLDAKTCALLDDIERSTSQVRAADLAASIQGNMRELRGKAGDRGVRQASMDVLMGATMPAVLIEVGFIDHPVEGEELMDAKVRGKMADAVAQAIFVHAAALASR